jgi:hypothetical protein
MGNTKDKSEDKIPALPVTDERLARIAAAERKTFKSGTGTEVKK